MSTAIKAIRKFDSSRLPSRYGWVTALLAAYGLVGAWWLFRLVIAGPCDGGCVAGIMAQIVRMATPVALAALGGVICARAGVVDVGIEGKMLAAAMFAYTVNGFAFQGLQGSLDAASAGNLSRLLALAAGVLSAVILAGLHASMSFRYKTNPIVAGMAINVLAIGVTGLCYYLFLSENLPAGPGAFPAIKIALLSDIPILGQIFFQQQPLTYILLITVFFIYYVFFYTPWGLRTRAVGENPKAAHTLGIDVNKIRWVNMLAGGVAAGLGGAWFTLEAAEVFRPLMTNGLGFIALAVMVFGKWNPFGVLLGALIFGLGSSAPAMAGIYRPDLSLPLPQVLLYLLAIAITTAIVTSIAPRKAGGGPYDHQ